VKKKKKKILVIDIGGTHVKLMISRRDKRKFDSGPRMTAKQMVTKIKETVAGWKFDAISIGFPSPVHNGRIMKDPKHLGKGWIGFDFSKALGKPVHVINDAAMQALGSYHGGRMLFLGLGTGLGSALVWEKTLMPLELGDLPYCEGSIIEDYLGKPGLALLGERAWKNEVKRAVRQLKQSFIADYVVLGGGNAKRFDQLPEGIEPGHNRNAFLGGTRLWETDSRTRQKKWRVV
jgi:polyphosphate glucokinase